MSELTKLDPDTAIDVAYDIFLEMAPENLDRPIFCYSTCNLKSAVPWNLWKPPTTGKKKSAC